MRRREFIGALASAAAWPLVAGAQQPAKPRRIAVVAPARTVEELKTNPYYRVFFDELNRFGFFEGQNLVVDRYSGGGQMDAYPELAQLVVRNSPEAILTSGAPMTFALRAVTSTIPIVTIIGDPVVGGFTSSLARPDRNVTGVTVDAGIELHGKRLALLIETKPAISRLSYLSTSAAWSTPQAAMVREAAQKAKLSVTHIDLGNKLDETAYLTALDPINRAQTEALLVSDEPEHLSNSRALVDLALKAKIPAMYPFRDLAQAGGLMAYYRDLFEALRTAADQISQILQGKNIAEIPFYQPTIFRLSINTKTAQKIGLDLPATLLAGADEVIE